jgi:hypothetical protein
MSTSTPNPVPGDPASSYRAIKNLIIRMGTGALFGCRLSTDELPAQA